MRTTIISMLLAYTCICATATDRTHQEKMSPLVRQAAQLSAIGTRQANAGKEQLICAFIRIDRTKAETVLGDNGCHIYDSRGDIFIAGIPTQRLNELSSLKCVGRIEARAPSRLNMDTTTTIVSALPVYAGEALPQAYTGSGVAVGVMDVGFDLTHPNFYNRDLSEYRIKALWDQLSTDTVGSGFHVGRDYTDREALLGKQCSTDGQIIPHGTHTLGIAAGSGYDTRYRGMAFESELCLVSNAVTSDLPLIAPEDVYKYTTATDALGFKYIFDYAAGRGMPCVASFSEGAVPGFDNEDSLYCEYLNKLTGPGRIIVASAGNESVYYNYIKKPAGTLRAGSFINCGNENANFFMQSDAPFMLRLISYGTTATDTLNINPHLCSTDTATIFRATFADGQHTCTASITKYHYTLSQNDTMYHVSLSCDIPLYDAPPLAVVIEGAGTDASVRCYSPTQFDNKTGEVWNDAEISHNIHLPAAFPGVIAVGSTIHRTGFTNYKGQYFDYSQSGRNDGVRSYYSSIGPTLDGRTKPDVMAPGDNIVSSYSSFYEKSNPDAKDILSDVAHFTHNGSTYAWNSNTGTSMATPVVAGAIALWLQAKPDLTPAEAIDIISRTSRQPEEGLTYPNNLYGYGEIDVYRGLLNIIGLDAIDDISTTQPQHVVARMSDDGTLCLHFSSIPANPFTLRIYSTNGVIVFNRTMTPESISADGIATISMSGFNAGIYAIQITGRDEGITGSTLIRR